MEINISTIVMARTFATAAHGAVGQVRKYSGEPYIIHPECVSAIVACAETSTPAMVAAAWLHDVVEDTKITLVDIERNFGPEIRQLVSEVTNISKPEDGNRAARKAIDRDHLSKASPAGKTIKLADIIDNCWDVAGADAGFARTYVREKITLLPLLKEGDPGVYARAKDTLVRASVYLGMDVAELSQL